MSFNANTIYKAVDADKPAKECKEATNQSHVYVVVDMFGYVNSIFRSRREADLQIKAFNKGDPDGYWTVEEHGLR